MSNEDTNQAPEKNEFAAGSNEQNAGIVSEFVQFLKTNKKYWMIPLLVTLLALGALIILGGTSAAPFIYTLF
ncbi:hypothetical protein F7C95_18375 [Opitutia bacterium ISCC 51]|nr:hypothetical protein F7C95_18375 [Opitutae bacterium ISCC 51]QXD27930.1 hypothetical protein GA003_18280 [Opitutae bacterium ISCC 52]